MCIIVYHIDIDFISSCLLCVSNSVSVSVCLICRSHSLLPVHVSLFFFLSPFAHYDDILLLSFLVSFSLSPLLSLLSLLSLSAAVCVCVLLAALCCCCLLSAECCSAATYMWYADLWDRSLCLFVSSVSLRYMYRALSLSQPLLVLFRQPVLRSLPLKYYYCLLFWQNLINVLFKYTAQ